MIRLDAPLVVQIDSVNPAVTDLLEVKMLKGNVSVIAVYNSKEQSRSSIMVNTEDLIRALEVAKILGKCIE